MDANEIAKTLSEEIERFSNSNDLDELNEKFESRIDLTTLGITGKAAAAIDFTRAVCYWRLIPVVTSRCIANEIKEILETEAQNNEEHF